MSCLAIHQYFESEMIYSRSGSYLWNLFRSGTGSEFLLNKFLLLFTDPVDVDAQTRDPQGRTPLMLAVCLGHLDSSKLLIEAGANVNTETEGWTVVQVG